MLDWDRVRVFHAVAQAGSFTRAAETGLGLASLPDYLAGVTARLQRVLPHLEGPSFTAYFVYPEELRTSKRVAVFRDFLLEKVAEQPVW